MPAAAPVLHYVHHHDFTPAQRAQLTKSHKKVEQLLGVTPSLRPLPPPIPSATAQARHNRSKSFAAPPSPLALTTPKSRTRTKSNARERGKLAHLFSIDTSSSRPYTTNGDTESTHVLTRVSTDSSSSTRSSSSSSSAASSDAVRSGVTGSRGTRYTRHRPPRLNLSCSNLSLSPISLEASTPEEILDISAGGPLAAGRPSVLDRVDIVDSPLSPMFKVELGRARSRVSIIQEREFNKAIQGLPNRPTDPKEKSKKLNRLGKVFGVLPPLEMVFPPSPTSRSRHDPKRYTLELPPPLVRGTLCDNPNEKVLLNRTITEVGECPRQEEGGNVIRVVDWDRTMDQADRQRVMDALRLLRG